VRPKKKPAVPAGEGERINVLNVASARTKRKGRLFADQGVLQAKLMLGCPILAVEPRRRMDSGKQTHSGLAIRCVGR
jgi:hypothetical protein